MLLASHVPIRITEQPMIVSSPTAKHLTALLLALALPACGGAKQAPAPEPPLSCTGFESTIPSEERQSLEVPPPDFRDYRYCEVIVTFSSGSGYCAEVYNTLSFSDCPESEWAALDPDAIKSEHGAEFVFMNGPRHWVVSSATGAAALTSSKIASFGNLQMARPAVVALQSPDELVSEAYIEREITRTNTWVYAAGSEIYELRSASDDVYVMQSYSRILDADQGIDDLAGLGGKLALPDGWSFSSRVLETEEKLVADGSAIVVADDLSNTYQRRP